MLLTGCSVQTEYESLIDENLLVEVYDVLRERLADNVGVVVEQSEDNEIGILIYTVTTELAVTEFGNFIRELNQLIPEMMADYEGVRFSYYVYLYLEDHDSNAEPWLFWKRTSPRSMSNEFPIRGEFGGQMPFTPSLGQADRGFITAEDEIENRIEVSLALQDAEAPFKSRLATLNIDELEVIVIGRDRQRAAIHVEIHVPRAGFRIFEEIVAKATDIALEAEVIVGDLRLVGTENELYWHSTNRSRKREQSRTFRIGPEDDARHIVYENFTGHIQGRINQQFGYSGFFQIFDQTQQVHEDLPAFTFYRVIGDKVTDAESDHTREVVIRIYDDEHFIQEIAGLTQRTWNDHFNWLEMTFITATPTGYASMWFGDGKGGLYFWNWDAEKGQFVETDTTIITMHQALHEDLPKFTFHHQIHKRYEEDYSWMHPVSITIEHGGAVLQEITNLEQIELRHGIEFIDLTGNGYLDMILTQRADGVGALAAPSYFWLWDTNLNQFILNNRLTNISQFTHVWVEDGIVLAYARRSMGSGGGGTTVLFEFSPIFNDFLLLSVRDCIVADYEEGIVCSYVETPEWIWQLVE